MSEKSKAILIVSLIIFLLSGASLYYGIVQHNRSIDSMIKVSENETHYILEAMNDATFQTGRWRIRHLLDANPQIVEAVATRNRKLLYELTLPYYEEYCCESKFHNIMHFHLPDNTTLLRMHRPDFFGDNLEDLRPIISTVNRNHEPLFGFEIGRSGAFYRIVQPIFYNNTYVGALEFGISAYQIIEVLEAETQIKSTAFFNERAWQNATHCRKDPVIKAGNFIFTPHNKYLSDMIPESFQLEKDTHPTITVDNQIYVVHSHRIFNDFQGKNLGGLILFQDITQIMKRKNSFIFQLSLLTAGLLVLAIIALYYTFGRIIGSLREKETKLSSIFRTAPTGIGVVVDRVFMDVNDKFCEIVGYSEKELLGENAIIIYPSQREFDEIGEEQLRQFKELGTGTIETRLQHKDGTIIEVLLNMTPQDINNLSAGITFTFMDITEIKNAEKKLKESENKFRSMMESMKDPVYIRSGDYLVEYMNPAIIKRVGRDATGESCYHALYDLDQPCPWCDGKDELQGTFFETDVVNPKDNRPYHVSHSPIVNEDGSVSNLIIARDTSKMKNLESQLLQSQKMESVGNLAGGVAHDFNNILTAIYGYSEMAMGHLEEGSDAWQDVNEIQKSGERAASLTRQLLAFSRKQAIMPKVINPNDLINDTQKMLSRLISEDIQMEISLDEQVGNIYADPGQLEQVILNLVVNARDAVKKQPEEAIKIIKVSTSQVFLDKDYVTTHLDSSLGRHLQLEVEDSGCGMSEEVLNHVFEPFYTTKGEGEGTGMGLATVYGIVKQNHGSVNVYSEPGQGATFKIYWPIIKEEVFEEANPELQTATDGTEVILLAEDDKPIQEIASRQLQKAGYTVIAADNGEDALIKAAAYQGSIDLLFTDAVMPIMGGKELSEKIKEIYPEISILFASGYMDNGIHQEILTLGKDRFINKPYNVQDVMIKIRRLLDEK